MAWYAPPALLEAAQADFPRSLARVPVLLPLPPATMRQQLDPWFEREGVRPRIAGEFEDSALLKTFGARASLLEPDALAAFAAGIALEDVVATRDRDVVVAGHSAGGQLGEPGPQHEAALQIAAHQPVVLGAVAQQLYQAMSLRGEGGKDFSAIVEGYRKKD